MEKFVNTKKFKIVLLASILCLILLKIVFYVCNEKYHLYILISDINQYIVNLTINILIVLAALFLLNFNAKRVRTYVQSGCAFLIIMILIYLHLFSNSDKRYFYFQSPDNTKTLVVEECAWLLAGWSDFYVKRGIFIEKLGSRITTDNGARPFTFNGYELKWLDNDTVELYYGYGGTEISPVYKTSIIHVK